MRRAVTILQELGQIHTVESLTEVFESIASVKIAKLRGRVVASKDFFAELWQTYSSLRVDPKEQLNRSGTKKNGRNVLVAVTSEGKLSGDIANKVIDELRSAYTSPQNTDIVVLGLHGANRLQQLGGITPKYVFHMPETDEQMSVTEIIEAIEPYEQISVFYQTYESIRVQRVARIELVSAVRELGDEVAGDAEGETEIVSSHEFIFEPGIAEIADYLESLMMGVALNQVLIESKLAQYASRFNAMNSAKHRAHEIGSDYDRMYHRAKRAEGDERLKETMKVIMAQGQQP